jgi:1-acyl-sn-glycerol-3-phosphate acyltransferase
MSAASAPLSTRGAGLEAVPTRQPWAARALAAVARKRFASDLDGLFVAGLDEARALVAEQPVILAATHVSWWDPMALLVLDQALGADGRALMDAENLRRLPFFGAVGAIPVHRNGDRGALRRDLAAAAACLDRPTRALWIFPQGRQRPATTRPLGLEPGVRLVARLAGVPVVPVALRYGWREADRPTALAHFGPALDPTDKRLLDRLEAALIRGLDAAGAHLDAPGQFSDMVPEGSPFRPLVAPTHDARRLDGPTRALVALTRVATRALSRSPR